MYMDNWFLTKLQRQYSGARIAFMTNGAETTGYPDANKWTSICKPHGVQKLKQNGSQI